MRKKINIIIISILFFFVIAVVYSLLFGKLFPYSPIIIGFTKHELPNLNIYIENGHTFKDFQKMNSYIAMVEDFHDLKFKDKPNIFFFGKKKTYNSLSLSNARFCAFYNGSIVVSPRAQKEAIEEKISMETYLRHELSHSLLHQHSGIINAAKYPKWLLEGIAVYSVNQMGTSWYPSKEETYTYIQQGNFMPPGYFKTKNEDQVKLDVKYRITFMYSEFACIVDYLMQVYGRKKFLKYMKQLIHGNNHDQVFFDIYQISFDKFISDFRNFVLKQS